MNQELFIIRLNLIKEERGLTDKQLGEYFGVSDGVVSNYRRAVTAPKRYNLIKYCQSLGLNYDWVIGKVDEPMLTTPESISKEQATSYILQPDFRSAVMRSSFDSFDILCREIDAMKNRITELEAAIGDNS